MPEMVFAVTRSAVGAFILVHVGARFWGQSIQLILEHNSLPEIRALPLIHGSLSPAPCQELGCLGYSPADGNRTYRLLARYGHDPGFSTLFSLSKHLHLIFAPLNSAQTSAPLHR
jgi:hypothetical protein